MMDEDLARGERVTTPYGVGEVWEIEFGGQIHVQMHHGGAILAFEPADVRPYDSTPSSDELIALTEARFLGMPERTDALLDELDRIDAELRATTRWQFFRRWRLRRDKLAYTGELQHNERIRHKRELDEYERLGC